MRWCIVEFPGSVDSLVSRIHPAGAKGKYTYYAQVVALALFAGLDLGLRVHMVLEYARRIRG